MAFASPWGECVLGTTQFSSSSRYSPGPPLSKATTAAPAEKASRL
eukprot:CAMPEP_0182472142 /NCGR_PEP_ID=MMETSP1319-20130603/21620_1 /TAXON_ID=172717 /ORGANISM="Bolidomonas pacifica, Strain RCC208" /LENGTH=44 /DNA_ID= /DNA_START= /DNA_END= /DNA_ORIENTATION=